VERYCLQKYGVIIKTGEERWFVVQDFVGRVYNINETVGTSAHSVLFGAENPKSILSTGDSAWRVTSHSLVYGRLTGHSAHVFCDTDIRVDDLIDFISSQCLGTEVSNSIVFYAEPNDSFGFTETVGILLYWRQNRLDGSAEEDPNFLMKFVGCATGSNYLPYDKRFKIYIELDFSLHPYGYPVFGQLIHVLRLPGYEVSFGHYQRFNHDMRMVVDNVYIRID
jgi:hypothetical protein